MKEDLSIERLLRWRLAEAEAGAPCAPRARELLERVRPWWERLPEKFQTLAAQLKGMDVAFGHAMSEPGETGGHPVPALIVQADEVETYARVIYFNIRDGRLRLRFQLETVPGKTEPDYEVTFVSDAVVRPLFSGLAILSVDHEYRIDVALPDALVKSWSGLKVTDRMPFRLILRAGVADGE